MKSLAFVVLSYVVGYTFSIEHDFKGFDDSILFGINWPGENYIVDLTDETVSNNFFCSYYIKFKDSYVAAYVYA